MKRTKSTMVALVAAGLLVIGTTLSAEQPKMGMGDMPMGRGMMSMMRDCPMMGMTMGAETVTYAEGRIAFLRAESLTALYAALGDEQKKKADQILTGMGCMM